MSKTLHSQNGNIKIATDDLQVFKLCMESEKFQVVTKMFAQQGKNKAAKESAACWFRAADAEIWESVFSQFILMNQRIELISCLLYSTAKESSEFLTGKFFCPFLSKAMSSCSDEHLLENPDKFAEICWSKQKCPATGQE